MGKKSKKCSAFVSETGRAKCNVDVDISTSDRGCKKVVEASKDVRCPKANGKRKKRKLAEDLASPLRVHSKTTETREICSNDCISGVEPHGRLEQDFYFSVDLNPSKKILGSIETDKRNTRQKPKSQSENKCGSSEKETGINAISAWYGREIDPEKYPNLVKMYVARESVRIRQRQERYFASSCPEMREVDTLQCFLCGGGHLKKNCPRSRSHCSQSSESMRASSKNAFVGLRADDIAPLADEVGINVVRAAKQKLDNLTIMDAGKCNQVRIVGDDGLILIPHAAEKRRIKCERKLDAKASASSYGEATQDNRRCIICGDFGHGFGMDKCPLVMAEQKRHENEIANEYWNSPDTDWSAKYDNGWYESSGRRHLFSTAWSKKNRWGMDCKSGPGTSFNTAEDDPNAAERRFEYHKHKTKESASVTKRKRQRSNTMCY